MENGYMKKVSFLCLIGFFGLLFCSRVWAWGGDHVIEADGKIKIGIHEDWPVGLENLINSGGCIHGHWVNANDEFFYKGDTATLNKFLEKYSTFKDTPLTLVIHAGSHRRSALWGEKPEKPYDWKLLVQKHGWGAPETDSSNINEKYVVTLDVWIDRDIKLAEIIVPANVVVKSGGEIEDFISKHKSK
jgi:hypothetical protein